MKRNYLYLLACALLAACTGSDDNYGQQPQPVDGEAAITFATDITTRSNVTRSNVNSLDDLKKLSKGFGVLAYFTDAQNWTTAKGTLAPSAFPPPDFMYNQPVRWGALYTMKDGSGNIIYDEDHNPVIVNDWVYSPLKYWPNYSDNDDGGAGAPRYISFFGYAPFTEISNAATGATVDGTTTGITTLTNNADRRPYLIYEMDEDGGTRQTDLLYAEAVTNAKRNGNGLIEVTIDGDTKTNTYQKVPMVFHHALAGVEVCVQRVYDEPTYSGKAPAKEQHTKLFVSQLKLTATNAAGSVGLFGSGRLDLETGQWTNTDGSTWPAGTKTLTYGEATFNDTVRGTAAEELDKIRLYELTKWGEGYDSKTDTWSHDYGVDEEERMLFRDSVITFIPSGGNITIVPTVQYSMVTRSDELLLSTLTDKDGHKYSRLVNNVDGNPLLLRFEAGKKYKLVIRIGVEHVNFEVVSVVDWDFPIRFNPTLSGGYTEEYVGKTINEQ